MLALGTAPASCGRAPTGRAHIGHAGAMDPRLAAVAAAQGGAFTAAQARAHGYQAHEIRRLRERGEWQTLRRGVYAEASLLHQLEAYGRARLQASALLLMLHEPAVLSHETSAAWQFLPMLEPDLERLHVTRADLHASRDEAGVHHHAARLPDDHLVVVDGRTVTAPARTAVDIARERSLRQGVAAVDSALRAGVSPEELRAVLHYCRSWPGARTASRAVSFGDGRAANPGESWSRLVLAGQGVPPDDLQVRIADADELVGVVDFYWRAERTVGEFDGKLKYKVPPGASPEEAGEIVFLEKRREDHVRDLGHEVVRWVWADLLRPEHLAARVRRAHARGQQRRSA